MKKIIISLLCSLLAFPLAAMDAPIHAFGYKTTALFPEIIEKLERDPHPWAKRFLNYLKASERQNRMDLENLLKANNAQELAFEEDLFKEKLQAMLRNDESQSDELLKTLNAQGFKPAEHWVLFTGLNKMLGINGEPGIYKDSLTFMGQNPWIFESHGEPVVELYDNQVTVAKNSLIYALAAKAGDPRVVKALDIVHPTLLPKDEIVFAKAKSITLYDEDQGILLKPSASYEFGANPVETGKNIWDCSSFIALVIESDIRFSTSDFEEAYKVQHGLTFANDMTKSIMKQFEIVELPAKLEFMDVLVWRGHSGGGHMAFYLGETETGTIIVGESNRTDDKSVEGTGISGTTLYRDGKTTYAFRMRDKRS